MFPRKYDRNKTTTFVNKCPDGPVMADTGLSTHLYFIF